MTDNPKLGPYRLTYISTWRNPAVRQLSSDEYRIYSYILTGPQSNRIGIFYFSTLTAADDLGFPLDGLPQAVADVCADFGWQYDPDARVLYLPQWWTENPPANPDHLKGVLKDLAHVHDCPLVEAFGQNTETLPASLRDVFTQEFAKWRPVTHRVEQRRHRVGQTVANISNSTSNRIRNSTSNKNSNIHSVDHREDALIESVYDSGVKNIGSDSSLDADREPAAPDSSTSVDLFGNVSANSETDGTDRKRLRKTPPPSGAAPAPMDGFDEFWDQYPKKVDKEDAKAVWKKLRPDPDLRQIIVTAVAAYARSVQSVEPKFILYPNRWLRKKRWEAEGVTALQPEPKEASANRLARIASFESSIRPAPYQPDKPDKDDDDGDL